MRVLLTGATGFVGSHLLARLLREPKEHTVAIVLRKGRDPWRIADMLDRVQVIEGDLARAHDLAESVSGFAPDTVLHLAWGAVRGKSGDLSQVDNVANTLELVKLAHLAGAGHFVGLGSQAEYGPCLHRIDEAQPARPISLYGTAKLCAGLLSGRMCAEAGLRFAWLRLFSAYGPKDDPKCLIPFLCRSFLAHEHAATTAGEQLWDYLYVEDAAEAIYRVALTPDASGVFNLGSGTVHAIREVAERLRDLMDPQAAIGFGAVPYASGQVMHLEANIDRLRRATGWESSTLLSVGLARTAQWHRQQSEPSTGSDA